MYNVGVKQYTYKHLACGGTFDYLHRGHRRFLEFAFLRAARVSVGITTDQMVHKNGKNDTRDLKIRLGELETFLKQGGYLARAKIVLLNDIFGSTLSDKTVDSLLLTTETFAGGRLVNKKRQRAGLLPLPIIVCPMAVADDGKIISTGRIKEGIINREGFSFYKFLSQTGQFNLPQKLRLELARPHGQLFSSTDEIEFRQLDSTVITVGDQTTSNFIKAGILLNLAIVDFKIARKKQFRTLSELGFSRKITAITVINRAGCIKRSLILAIIKIFQENLVKPAAIRVLGEEDLAVLPVVLLAPVGSSVFYGQPDQGVVCVKVTEEKKAEFLKILGQFKIII